MITLTNTDTIIGVNGTDALVGSNSPGGDGGIAEPFGDIATLTNLGTITGGAGGSGSIGGHGGNGGAGVLFSFGGTLTNSGAITGGAGGGGGPSSAGIGGNGGAGGGGVLFSAGGTLTNSTVITGGAGGNGAFSLGNGGSGGAGGGGVLLSAGGTLTNSGAINGGSGGDGGFGQGAGSNGGIGGAGSGGVLFSAGGTLTNSTVITGGAGGAGGEDLTTNGGSGGAGGGGVLFSAGGTLTNSGVITGGTGGTGRLAVTIGGSGGAGGGGVLFSAGGTLTNSGAINGGSGGKGGIGGTPGGSGGAGGTGVQFGGSAIATNSGSITGGAGGAGGQSLVSAGGNGGNGGVGISAVANTTINNSGTIAGGAGGNRGTGTTNGNFGTGGVGIVGAGLTVINSGAITGGLSGDGVTRANAISFTGGTNILELRAGSSITSNVAAFSAADTFRLGGSASASFDISLIGTQYQNFGIFQKTGSSTWTITGTNAAATPWTISAGTFELGTGASMHGGVTFAGNAATLRLDSSVNQIGGAISGAAAGDDIDLGFIGFAAGDHTVWQQNTPSAGTLTVLAANGTTLATLALTGQYIPADFKVAADNQNDVLVKVTTPHIGDDFNADHKADVLWRGSNGSLIDWGMNGGAIASSSVVTANGSVVAPDATFSVAGLSDFNGDGNSDILWRSTSGALIDWTMNGAVIASSANITSNGALVQPDASFSIAGVGDFNGDGNSDILWRSTSGALIDWTMNGAVIASSANITSNGALVQPDASFSIAGVGDFNGDGNSDILWRSTSGALIDWTMNGSVITSSANITSNGAVVQPDASFSVAGVGDFNGDGKSDILWRNTSSSLVEWLMNGSTIVSSATVTSGGVAVTPDATWHVVEVGDFNGDGNSDILWRNDNGTPVEWLMNGTAITQSLTPTFNGTPISPDATFTTQSKPTNFA